VKRFGILIALVVAASIAVIAVASVVVPVDAVRTAVTSEIQAVTGIEPELRGAVSVRMFPAATVHFSDVVLGAHDTGAPAFAAEELTANLRLIPLLTGHIEIADIVLTRPRIDVTFESDGRTNWSSLIDTLARALKPDASRDDRLLSFSEIRIDNGVVAIHVPDRGADETLQAVELSLAWPSIAKSFAATGHFTWHDENVDANIAVADFPAALAGDTSGVKLRLASGPLKLAFDGTFSGAPSLKMDGTFAADSVSLREALRWVGDKALPPGGGLGRFALKAHAALNSGAIALSSANIELDGNVAEGALIYATAGRQVLQGTLAVEKLDLSPYSSVLRLVADRSDGWDATPLAPEWLNGWDADLRLSAARVHFTRADLGRTAIAATVRAGRLDVTVAESQSYNGRITGNFTVANSETASQFKAQMQFADVDLEKCLSDLFGIRNLSGTGTLGFSMETAGTNVEEFVGNLNGAVQVTATKGALTGLNVEQLLRRLQRSPLSNNGDYRSGRTPFDKLNIGLRVVQGIATAEDVHFNGPSVGFTVTGTASIAARDLDLSGTANLIAPASDPKGSFELPFVVQGPWGSPLIMPDPQTLIHRSEATAPLIDALKDRQTRDAVRAVIERFTGSGARSADPR